MSNVGTYIIRHPSTGVFYIGSTSNYAHRKAQHTYLLRRGQHHAPLLQQAWEMNPEITWEFTPFESQVSAEQHEQQLLIQNFGSLLMANVSLNARGQSTLSDETRNKISAANTGRVQSEETIRKRFASRKGYTHSDETRRKMSEALTGKPISDAAKQKMREAKLGKKPSPLTIAATREKMGIKISIDGIVYGSIREASKALHISFSTIKKRITSDSSEFTTWFYLT